MLPISPQKLYFQNSNEGRFMLSIYVGGFAFLSLLTSLWLCLSSPTTEGMTYSLLLEQGDWRWKAIPPSLWHCIRNQLGLAVPTKRNLRPLLPKTILHRISKREKRGKIISFPCEAHLINLENRCVQNEKLTDQWLVWKVRSSVS